MYHVMYINFPEIFENGNYILYYRTEYIKYIK